LYADLCTDGQNGTDAIHFLATTNDVGTGGLTALAESVTVDPVHDKVTNP